VNGRFPFDFQKILYDGRDKLSFSLNGPEPLKGLLEKLEKVLPGITNQEKVEVKIGLGAVSEVEIGSSTCSLDIITGALGGFPDDFGIWVGKYWWGHDRAYWRSNPFFLYAEAWAQCSRVVGQTGAARVFNETVFDTAFPGLLKAYEEIADEMMKVTADFVAGKTKAPRSLRNYSMVR